MIIAVNVLLPQLLLLANYSCSWEIYSYSFR